MDRALVWPLDTVYLTTQLPTRCALVWPLDSVYLTIHTMIVFISHLVRHLVSFCLPSCLCLRAISCLPSCLCLCAILFSTLPSCFRLRVILFSIESMGADVSFPYSFDIGSDINPRSGYCTFTACTYHHFHRRRMFRLSYWSSPYSSSLTSC